MIPLVDLVKQYLSIKSEIDDAIQDVLLSGKFILGPNEKAFEQEIAEYLGVKHAIGVASGTDALTIAMRAMNINSGDEVIVPAYSFFATAGAVKNLEAEPVFVDINPTTYLIDFEKIESAISPKTKAIIPVHLYGQPADMDEINSIAKRHNLIVIEDNAQAFGATYKGKRTGSLGDISCISFYPTKNLGGYGDGGMIATNDDELAEQVRMLRTHGWKKKYYPEMIGYNSRLDEIQAAILRVKLKHLDEWNTKRRVIANHYSQMLSQNEIVTPVVAADRDHVYHLYIIRSKNRDAIMRALNSEGIASEIYYPQPLHLTKPFRKTNNWAGMLPEAENASLETFAIPLFPEMTSDQIEAIIDTINGV